MSLPFTILEARQVAVLTRVEVQVEPDGEVGDVVTDHSRLFEATILGRDPSIGVLLGWPALGAIVMLNKAFSRTAPAAFLLARFPTASDPGWGYFYLANLETEVVVRSSSASTPKAKGSGMTCKRCNGFNEWAEANKPDGSYLCFQCRP